MRIDYKLVDLRGEKYLHITESYVDLLPDVLHWKAKFISNVLNDPDDEFSTWSEKNKNMEQYVRKTHVMGVGITFFEDANVFQVFIDATGLNGSIDVYFKSETKAHDFAKKIVDWMLDKLVL